MSKQNYEISDRPGVTRTSFFLSAQVPLNFTVVLSQLRMPSIGQGCINTVRQVLQPTDCVIVALDISGSLV